MGSHAIFQLLSNFIKSQTFFALLLFSLRFQNQNYCTYVKVFQIIFLSGAPSLSMAAFSLSFTILQDAERQHHNLERVERH
jgi:hypothetical protein